MARTISPATAVFPEQGNALHPVEKGGFGATTVAGIKANIGGLDRSNTTGQGGVVPIGTNGKANLSSYGISSNSVTSMYSLN